jgi:hypothetical protein
MGGDFQGLTKRMYIIFSGNMSTPLFIGVVLLSVLFGLDVATTTMVLSLGGMEGNVLMSGIAQFPFLHLLIKGITMIAIALVVRWADTIVRGIGLYPLSLVIVVYAIAVANNVGVLLLLRG